MYLLNGFQIQIVWWMLEQGMNSPSPTFLVHVNRHCWKVWLSLIPQQASSPIHWHTTHPPAMHWEELTCLLLKPRETQYRTSDHELLGYHLEVMHFYHFAEGRTFNVITDQKKLLQYTLSTPWNWHTLPHSTLQQIHLVYHKITSDMWKQLCRWCFVVHCLQTDTPPVTNF